MQLSEALQTQLESRFPELFADKDSEDSRMSDGCCFGDGWFALFEALCTQNRHFDHKVSIDMVLLES